MTGCALASEVATAVPAQPAAVIPTRTLLLLRPRMALRPLLETRHPPLPNRLPESLGGCLEHLRLQFRERWFQTRMK